MTSGKLNPLSILLLTLPRAKNHKSSSAWPFVKVGRFELCLSLIVELGNEQVHSILKFVFISCAWRYLGETNRVNKRTLELSTPYGKSSNTGINFRPRWLAVMIITHTCKACRKPRDGVSLNESSKDTGHASTVKDSLHHPDVVHSRHSI